MSSSLLRNISIGAAIIGFLDSVYLTWIKLSNQEAVCSGVGGCEKVNTSAYSEIAGIPIALLGAGAYVIILILFIVENRSRFWEENSPLYIFGVSLIGVLYSGYLTYIEIAIIHAICPYCVLSAITILIIFVISIYRLRQALT